MDFMIGKPYSFRYFNCWDYAVDIRSQANIKTSVFQPVNLKNAFEIITAEMQKLGHGLTKVDTPNNFDIAIVHKCDGSRIIYHCGVYHDGNIAHCSRSLGQVVYEPLNDFKNKYDGCVFWR